MSLFCLIYFIMGLIIGWFGIFIGTPIKEVNAIWAKVAWLFVVGLGFAAIWYITFIYNY